MAAISSPIPSREPSPKPGRRPREKATKARASKFASNQSSLPTDSQPASPLLPQTRKRGSQLEMSSAADVVHHNQGGTLDTAPLERPWWMNIHGEGPAVADLDEVMDQFLCDPGAQAIENDCRKTVNRFDVRNMEKILPDIEQDELASLQKWYGYMQDFTKYRHKVEKQMDLRMQRKHHKQEPWDDSDSDDNDDSGSETRSVQAAVSMRSEVADSLSGMSLSAGSRALGAGASLKSGRRGTITAKPSRRLTMVGALLAGQGQQMGM